MIILSCFAVHRQPLLFSDSGGPTGNCPAPEQARCGIATSKPLVLLAGSPGKPGPQSLTLGPVDFVRISWNQIIEELREWQRLQGANLTLIS